MFDVHHIISCRRSQKADLNRRGPFERTLHVYGPIVIVAKIIKPFRFSCFVYIKLHIPQLVWKFGRGSIIWEWYKKYNTKNTKSCDKNVCSHQEKVTTHPRRRRGVCARCVVHIVTLCATKRCARGVVHIPNWFCPTWLCHQLLQLPEFWHLRSKRPQASLKWTDVSIWNRWQRR